MRNEFNTEVDAADNITVSVPLDAGDAPYASRATLKSDASVTDERR